MKDRNSRSSVNFKSLQVTSSSSSFGSDGTHEREMVHSNGLPFGRSATAAAVVASNIIHPTSILKKRDPNEFNSTTGQSMNQIQSILKRHSVPDVDRHHHQFLSSSSLQTTGGGSGPTTTIPFHNHLSGHSNHHRRSSGDFHRLQSTEPQQSLSTCHFAIGHAYGPTVASSLLVSHSIDPHPILKNKSLTGGKDTTKEETRPKSILKKKTHSVDSSNANKVKPILKKNKSSEDFHNHHHHHNISSSSQSSSSSSLSNSSICSLPRSIRRNSDSP